MTRSTHRIFLAGATSTVGRNLARELERRGCRVRCVLPEPRPNFFPAHVEVIAGDPRDPEALRAAMQGTETAYCLASHAASDGPFGGENCRSLFAFADAARQAGVRRIFYLSGLSSHGKYSGHVCGAEDVREALRKPGVPVVEFRTSLILGAGSLAFEILREIAEGTRIIGLPRWMRLRAYPMAIEDVGAQLADALEMREWEEGVFELRGPERASFADLLKEYVRQRRLKRVFVPLPLLMPRLSILALSLIAPTFARFGQELVASLCSDGQPEDSRPFRGAFPPPKGIREMIRGALASGRATPAETAARESTAPKSTALDAARTKFGLRIVDSRSVHVPYAPPAVFRPIERIGGKTGWYYANWLWRLRGALDALLGGKGMRNGRRHPQSLAAGDPVDLWRVERIEPNHLLRLAAEMKLPGRAWLQFEIDANGAGSRIRQTAIFDPVGVVGLLYWYLLYPVHEMIFPGLLKGIARAIPSHQEEPEVEAAPSPSQPR